MVDVERVLAVVSGLENSQANWQGAWNECIKYCSPQSKMSSEMDSDGEYHPAPVNGTGIRACNSLAGNLYANGCAVGQEWFAFSVNLPEKDINRAMTDWAITASKTTLRYLGASNFYSVIQHTTQDFSLLGTCCVFSDFVKGSLMYRNFPINHNIFIQTNDRNEVDTLARKFKYTAKEAYQAFGDRVSEKIRSKITEGKNTDLFEFVQFIYPRSVYGEAIDRSKKDKLNMSFGSVFIEVAEKNLVKTEGFTKFPFAVARFYASATEAYGRSPGMNAMEDIKTLQRVESDMLDAAEYAGNPAIIVDDRAEEFSTECGAVNRVSNFNSQMCKVIELGNNLVVDEKTILRKEQAVKEAFYYDLFMHLEQHKYMTAREVDARELQKAQSIAPVVTSYQSELLGAILKRTYFLLRAKKIIPAPPAGVKDEDVNVVYTSRLNSLLKQVEVANLMTALNQAAGLFQFLGQFPDARYYINVNEALDSIAYGNNIAPGHFYTAQETEKMIEAAEAKQAERDRLDAMMGKIKPVDTLKSPQPGSMAETMQNTFGGTNAYGR